MIYNDLPFKDVDAPVQLTHTGLEIHFLHRRLVWTYVSVQDAILVGQFVVHDTDRYKRRAQAQVMRTQRLQTQLHLARARGARSSELRKLQQSYEAVKVRPVPLRSGRVETWCPRLFEELGFYPHVDLSPFVYALARSLEIYGVEKAVVFGMRQVHVQYAPRQEGRFQWLVDAVLGWRVFRGNTGYVATSASVSASGIQWP